MVAELKLEILDFATKLLQNNANTMLKMNGALDKSNKASNVSSENDTIII